MAGGLAALVIVCGVAVGCSAGEGIVSPSVAGAATFAPPSATIIGATTTNTPYEGLTENRCNGEFVPVRGHVSYSFFVSDTDVTHQKVKFSWVVDGTGSLGNVYHGVEEYMEQVNVSILPLEQTFVHNVRLTSKTAPDYRDKMLFHLTISGKGEVTARVERGPTPECRE